MARTHPNSKLNPRKLDADQAYNRAVNRGEIVALTVTDVDQIGEQTSSRFPGRLTGDEATNG